MTSAADPASASLPPSPAGLPDNLPPVKPPSASFIMQLFLVPGVIVAAVIGVWALFGRISAGEQDWRQQIADIQSNNDHRRWRAATSLAQMLRADIELGSAGQKLSQNPQIARELCDLMKSLLAQTGDGEQLTSQQSFVATALGWLDATDIVLPVLWDAAGSGRTQLVRVQALRSIAVIADRTNPSDQDLRTKLIESAKDSDVLVRQVAIYGLGLVPGEDVDSQLIVALEDSDPHCRANASIALARKKHPAGVDALLKLVKSTAEPPVPATGGTEEERRVAANAAQMNLIVLLNALRAMKDVVPIMSVEQRAAAQKLCTPLSESFPDMKIRIEAKTTLRDVLEQAAAAKSAG